MPVPRNRNRSCRMHSQFLRLALVLQLAAFVLGFYQASVVCDPAVVGNQGSTLTAQIVTEQPVEIGGKIQIQVPKQASVLDGSHLCSVASEGLVNADNVSCNANSAENSLTFTLDFNLPAYAPVTIRFKNLFNVPFSTEPIDSFIFTTIGPNGETIERQDTDIKFEDELQIASLKSASLLQVDSFQVGNVASAYITVMTQNPIPAGGGVQVKLPKWNPLANSGLRESYIVLPKDYAAVKAQMAEKRLLQTSTSLCAPKSGVDAAAKCLLETTLKEDYLTLINAFPNGVKAGTQFSFFVNYIRNPISASPVTLTIQTFSGIAEKTQDTADEGSVTFAGLIDQGAAILQAKDGATMNPANSVIKGEPSVIQEYSTLYVPFSVPVPVQKGCRLLIKLPDDFHVTEGMISMVQGWGIFNSRILRAEVDAQARTIKIIDQCSDYSTANLQSTVQIQSLLNPSYVLKTQSFQISLLDSNANMITNLKSDVFYTPSAGTIKDVSLVPVSGNEIQKITNIVLTFTPPHAIKGASRITVKLPDKIEFGKCNQVYTTTTNLIQTATCTEKSAYEFQFDSPFTSDFAGNQAITIAFKNRVLPSSVVPIKGIEIKTYQIVNGTPYLVDQLVAPELVLFEMKAVQFFSASLKSTSEVTYTNTGLTFRLMVASTIPSNGLVRIYFPPEVTVPDYATAANSCNMPSIPDRQIKCTFSNQPLTIVDAQGVSQTTSATTLVVEQVFGTGLRSQDDFEIGIRTGVMTPISLKTSGTFIVQVLDSSFFVVNYINTALLLTMSTGIDIGPLDFQTDSYTVGALTTHSLSFTSPIPLVDRSRIYIIIPPEVEVPQPGQFQVTSSTPDLIKDFAHSIIGNKVTIIVKSAAQLIAKGTKMSFTFGQVKNPQSMAASSPYKVEIQSSDLYVEAVQVTQGAKVRCRQPSEITKFDFTAADLRQGALTTITISWWSTQYYPADLWLKINFNTDEMNLKLPENAENQDSTDCFFRNQLFVKCLIFEDYIQIKNVLTSPQTADQPMSITITNMQINVFKSGKTKSWKLTTFTGNDEIDQVSEGLSFDFKCDYPCYTCVGDATECKSCNDYDSGTYMILFQNKCYLNCPDGTYEESFQCKPCNSRCKTCGNSNAQWCTSCNVDSEFPFLDGSTCAEECSFGKFGNLANGKCEPCHKPCETCVGDAGTCLSCFQTAEEKFLGHSQCLTKCPARTVADVTKKSTICQDCSSNCADCIGTPTNCSACPSGLFLNMLDYTCVETCPADLTVMNVQTGQCELCDSSCLTCEQDTKQCTSCRPLFNQQEGKCTLECDTMTFKTVPLDGVCVDCDPSCKTCQGTKTNCLSCWEGSHWYNTKCVSQCPTIEGYKYVPNKITNKCEIDGIKCKFGYKVSDSGDFCELLLQVCEPPTTLNYDKTKCLPGSDQWFPFPIWLFWIAPTFLILLISKLKARETQLATNMIVFLSIGEIAGMIYTVYLARIFGILPVQALISFAVAIHFGINMFFLLVFTKQVKNDTALSHWCQWHKKITTTITIIGTIFNFKAYRLFFSRLFGRDEFHAPMESPIIFYGPFNLSSVINMVLVKLVVMFGCAFGIYYIRWGYQLLIECIELLVIEILILVLNVIEYLELKKSGLMVDKQYQKISAKKVNQANVMGVEFSDDDDHLDPASVDPKTKERRAQPKSTKNINRLERILADLDLNEERKKYLHTMADEDSDEMEVMRRHRRHCVSFKGLPIQLPDAWQSDGDDHCDQNFISEPNSPRSKQMLHNSQFISRMFELRQAYKTSDLGDNVYTDSYDPNSRPMRSAKVISVKVQTNVMELLGLDDLQQPGEKQNDDSEESSHFIEDELDESATRKLINNVIGAIDSDADSDKVKQAENQWLHDVGKAKHKKRKLTKKRMAEIPNFNPEEILGEFMKDQDGYNLMVRGKTGKLNDMHGRLVNRRGYLVSKAGNVCTRGGIFIFRSEELNDDDEIPAPYCLSKASQMLFRVMDQADYKKYRRQHKIAMQDQYIENEYQRLKKESEQVYQRKQAEKPEASTLEPFDNHETYKGRNAVGPQARKTEQLKDSVENLSDILKPIVPKTKKELLGMTSSSFVSNGNIMSEKVNLRGKISQPVSLSSGEREMNYKSSEGRSKSRGSQMSRGSRETHAKKQRLTSGKRSGRISTRDEQNVTGFDLSNQLIHVKTDSNSLIGSHDIEVPVVPLPNDQLLIDLKFDKPRQKKKKKSKVRPQANPQTKVHDSRPVVPKAANVYAENQRRMDATRNEIKQDEQFIDKLTQFSRDTSKKRANLDFQITPWNQPNDDIKVALRHQNLGAIYGRVKQKFNHQIRANGASLKFGQNPDIFAPEKYATNTDIDLLGRLKSSKDKKAYGQSKLADIKKIYSSTRPVSSNERQLNQSKSKPRVYSSNGQMQNYRSQTSQAVLFHDITAQNAKERTGKKNADLSVSEGQADVVIALEPSSFVSSRKDGAFDLLHGKFI